MNNGLAAVLGIEHVFVLMLENRSFDHMLGFSGITGKDAENWAADHDPRADRGGVEQLRRPNAQGVAGS